MENVVEDSMASAEKTAVQASGTSQNGGNNVVSLGPRDSGQHDRLEVALHRVHGAVDDAPFELGEKSLVAVQLGQPCPPEPAVEVEPRRRAASTWDEHG